MGYLGHIFVIFFNIPVLELSVDTNFQNRLYCLADILVVVGKVMTETTVANSNPCLTFTFRLTNTELTILTRNSFA